MLSQFQWLPAFFAIKYTHGLSNQEGVIPIPVNELIGMIAAIEILSDLQSANKYNSTSVSQDGLSQSASSSGPQIYVKRIEDLTIKKDKAMAKLKAIFTNRYFLSNI